MGKTGRNVEQTDDFPARAAKGQSLTVLKYGYQLPGKKRIVLANKNINILYY